jgi:hypothetical protein
MALHVRAAESSWEPNAEGEMSVEDPRHAAAQRTAAASRRVRAFRLATWLLIVPALSFFSFSVVAGARGLESKPDYAGAVRQAKSLDLASAIDARQRDARAELRNVPSVLVQLAHAFPALRNSQ